MVSQPRAETHFGIRDARVTAVAAVLRDVCALGPSASIGTVSDPKLSQWTTGRCDLSIPFQGRLLPASSLSFRGPITSARSYLTVPSKATAKAGSSRTGRRRGRGGEGGAASESWSPGLLGTALCGGLPFDSWQTQHLPPAPEN